MGTRGSYGFKKDGKYKVTYNHYDSYPEGLGGDILKYIKSKTIEELNEVFDNLRMVSEVDKPPTSEDIENFKIYSDLGVSSGKPSEWYVLLRLMQGKLHLHEEAGIMIDNKEGMFGNDYTYIIDLDVNKLLIYKWGKLSARNIDLRRPPSHLEDKYY